MSNANKIYLTETYIIPNSTVPNYPAAPQVEENQGWCKRNNKNKPQSNSAGTASLILISGGMNMAWNLGFTLNPSIGVHILTSWFIGGIIGAIVGAIACNHIQKKILVCFASFLVIISGILKVSDQHSYDAIIASRYLNGIAVGLVFPLTFVLVGEEMAKSLRGMNAAAIDTMSFGSGIFIQAMYSYFWPNDIEEFFGVTQMDGVLNIIWGFSGFIMTLILLIESPVFYLARDQEQMAIDALRRLQRPCTITYETFEQLEELKRYLAESKETSFLQSAVIGLPALMKLCIYRSFMALSFSFLTNYAFTYASTLGSYSNIWPFYLYGLARWLGAMLVIFSLDSRGRKPSMIIGFIICCILAFIVGGIFDDKQHLVDIDYMNIVKYVLIFYQLFASISMASSSIYLSEAFPLAVKPYYIAIVFIVEMLVHIIICCSNAKFYNVFILSEYFYTVGALSFVFILVAIFLIPETKLDTLRECLTKFRKLISFKS